MDTVLLVEDDGELRRMFRTALSFAGYRVVEAGDGLVALQVLDATSPDLIVLDLGLPFINGHALRAELAGLAQLRDIPIVVVTGEDVDRLEPPVACLLHKPVSPEQLLQAVRRCLAAGSGPAGAGR